MNKKVQDLEIKNEEVLVIEEINKDKINKDKIDKDKIDNNESTNRKIIVMLMSLGIGLLFNYFFIWDFIGISGFIFSTVVIGFSLYTIHQNINLKKKMGYIFLVPIVLLTLTFSIFNNFVLSGLNILIIPILIICYILTVRYEDIKKIDISFIGNILDRIFIKSLSTLPKFFLFIKEITKNRKKIEKNSVKRKIIRGLLISIPLLVVIVLLLTSADMIFKYYLGNITDVFEGLSISNFTGHTIVVVIVGLYMFGFIWSLKYNDLSYNSKNTIKIKSTWDPITIITIIFVINIAYLLFTIIQFSYLYSGGVHVLPDGLTYAEYARKGFFELILVTMINFVILLLSINFVSKENKTINKVANISYSMLILFTFNMLFSSFYKMNLYEKAFGFTRLRIFVQAFMLLIGILLFIVFLGIWFKRIPIFKYAVISTIIVYVGLNFINVDKIIAKENIERYEETNKIDIYYIKLLSYDAIDEIEKLLEVDDWRIRKEAESYISDKKRSLNKNYDKWYEYNYYKSKVLKLN